MGWFREAIHFLAIVCEGGGGREAVEDTMKEEGG